MLQSIRLLRGVAALLVVIYHAFEYARTHGYPELAGTFTNGAFGVDIFFIISGYVMLLALDKAAKSNQSPRQAASDFMARRIIRIAPIYWIGTSTLYFLYAIQPEKFRNFSATFEQYICSILFLPIVNSKSTINPVLSQGWTLYHEFYFYVIIAIAILFVKPKKARYLAPLAVTAICMLLNAALHSTKLPWIELAASPINVEFALGCCLYLIVQKQTKTNPVLGVGALVLATLLLIATPHDLSKVRDFHRLIYWGTPAALIFYGAIQLEHVVKNSLELFNRFVGDPSYSLYIFHGLAFSASDIVVKKLIAHPSPWVFVAIMTIGSVLACNLIFKLIEDPATRALNKLWRNKN